MPFFTDEAHYSAVAKGLRSLGIDAESWHIVDGVGGQGSIYAVVIDGEAALTNVRYELESPRVRPWTFYGVREGDVLGDEVEKLGPRHDALVDEVIEAVAVRFNALDPERVARESTKDVEQALSRVNEAVKDLVKAVEKQGALVAHSGEDVVVAGDAPQSGDLKQMANLLKQRIAMSEADQFTKASLEMLATFLVNAHARIEQVEARA